MTSGYVSPQAPRNIAKALVFASWFLALPLTKHVIGQFPKCLTAEFNGTKSDDKLAAFGRWMQLSQGNDRIAVLLLIKGDKHSETIWVFGILPVNGY